MTRPIPAVPALLLALWLPAPGHAQDPATERPDKPDLPAAGSAEAAALLDKALDKMLAIGRGSFSTEIEQENMLTRQTGGRIGRGEATVDGRWSDAVVFAQVNDEGDEVLVRGGRMLARDGDGWKLRRSVLPSGMPAPFVLDPKLLFSVLAALPQKARAVRHVEAAKWRDKELVILGLTLQGEVARDLDLSGAIPTTEAGGTRIFGPGGQAQPPAETTIDLAFYIDPDRGDVHRLRIKTYKESALGGNVQIAFAGGGGAFGAGGGQGAEDEVTEEDARAEAEGRPRYKGGLPVRKVGDNESVMYYRVTFRDHGMAEMPEIDARAMSLLGGR